MNSSSRKIQEKSSLPSALTKGGKPQQVVTCYQHAGKTGHRQREHSISGKKSQQDRNTGWYQRQWAEIYRVSI